MDYIVAQRFFKEHNYRQSFSAFKKIAEDQNGNLILRANSFNMMGVIVNGFSRDLDPEDELGFKYFEMAIQLDPNNIGALLNVVEYYEDMPSPNNQLQTFKMASERLLSELSNHITSDQLLRVKTKYNKFL